MPDVDAHVDGFMLDDVDPVALARLDSYEDEGALYVRRRATAEVDGRTVECDVYVGAGIVRR